MRWFALGEPLTREQAEELMARDLDPARDPRDRIWAVVERATDTVIGHGILQRLDKHDDLIEVGYGIGERYWGRGYATEIARAIVAHGFRTTELEKIVGITRPENAASQRVLAKTGLTFKGMSRFYNLEVTYYEITRAQFQGENDRK